MAPLKVLVSGGGIAGNAISFWLSKSGHNVTVIERASELRVTGLQVDLRGHGIEVMKRMGLEEAFRSRSIPEQGWQLVDTHGKRRAFFPANTSGKGRQSFTSEYEIMRGDLVRIMYEVNQDRTRYLFKTTIKSYEQKNNSVYVHFSDDTVDTFDLLIGADGQWSRTRKLMLKPDEPSPFHPIPGFSAAYFTAPKPIAKDEGYLATWYAAPQRRSIMTRRHSPTHIQIYLACETDSALLKTIRHGDTKEEKAALTDIYRGAGWQTEELLDAMHKADDFYCERLGVVKMDSWSRGRVVLLGDAAYCPSANTGMGTTSSIVGAYILAGEIQRCYSSQKERGNAGETKDGSSNAEKADSLETALKAYEHTFRPFMTQVQEGVIENTHHMPASSFGIFVFQLVAGVASLLKLNVVDWFLKEDVGEWVLPGYGL